MGTPAWLYWVSTTNYSLMQSQNQKVKSVQSSDRLSTAQNIQYGSLNTMAL